MAIDPIKYALWGMIVGNFEQLGVLPISNGGEAIAKTLEGEDFLEKLSQFDGEDNYEIYTKDDIRYVLLKECPFNSFYEDAPPWSSCSLELVAEYNQRPGGGGTLSPLCLLHKRLRKSLRADIFTLACRSAQTGKIEISTSDLKQAQISIEEIIRLLENKACIFAHKNP